MPEFHVTVAVVPDVLTTFIVRALTCPCTTGGASKMTSVTDPAELSKEDGVCGCCPAMNIIETAI